MRLQRPARGLVLCVILVAVAAAVALIAFAVADGFGYHPAVPAVHGKAASPSP